MLLLVSFILFNYEWHFFPFFFSFNFAALKCCIFMWQLPLLSENNTLHSKTILPSQKILLHTINKYRYAL